MIANCPACGTHYKHEHPVVPARGRCGRCDARIDLSRLRPYRIVTVGAPRPEDAARAARHLPIGLDDPALATTIARNVDRPAPRESSHLTYRVQASDQGLSGGAAVPPVDPPRDAWESEDPLPPIPEMTTRRAFEPSVPPLSEADMLDERMDAGSVEDVPEIESPVAEGRGTTFALWLAAGAIVGTGASWTLGGTTSEGVAVGALMGALTGWGWVRWTSPR